MKLKHDLALYLELYVKSELRKNTQDSYTRIINNHIIPALGNHTTKLLTKEHLKDFHKSLAHKPYVANRAIAVLGSFFKWAQQSGRVHKNFNPASKIPKYPEYEKERYLTPEEFGLLCLAINKYPNVYVRGAILLLIYTGFRKSEVLSLRWDQVNLDHRYIHLKQTKTKPRKVVINEEVVEVLTVLRDMRRSIYVIPGRDLTKPRATIDKAWQEIRADAFLDDVRLHDLRHSFASILAGNGESLLVIKTLLGHIDLRSTSRYAHLADKAVQLASVKAGKRIKTLMKGKKK